MTFHHIRAPRPAAAPPAARQPGPVTMALRAMREAVTAPPASGPVTAAIRTMRAVDPAFDLNPDLRALRRALADRIEADIAALDMLGGDPDIEQDAGEMPEGQWANGDSNSDADDEDAGDEELTLGWAANAGQAALGPNTEDGDATALETFGAGFRRSGHEDDEDSHDREGMTDDTGIADRGGEVEQACRHLGLTGYAPFGWATRA